MYAIMIGTSRYIRLERREKAVGNLPYVILRIICLKTSSLNISPLSGHEIVEMRMDLVGRF